MSCHAALLYMCSSLPSIAQAAGAQDHAGMRVSNLLITMSADQQLWEEADMISVVRYLRGAKSLVIPADIKDVLSMWGLRCRCNSLCVLRTGHASQIRRKKHLFPVNVISAVCEHVSYCHDSISCRCIKQYRVYSKVGILLKDNGQLSPETFLKPNNSKTATTTMFGQKWFRKTFFLRVVHKKLSSTVWRAKLVYRNHFLPPNNRKHRRGKHEQKKN